MSDLWGIAWLVLLLALNAFFVGAEFAVVAARRSSIEPRAKAGNRRARVTLYAMEHVTLMLASTQLGITICSLLILNVSEPAIHHLLAAPLTAIGVGEQATSVISFVSAVIIVSFLHVVFGEMVPKNIAFAVPDRSAIVLAPILVGFSRVFHVVVVALNSTADALLRLVGVQPKSEANTAFTLDQVATIVEESSKEGVYHDTTGTTKNAFEFTERVAGDTAVPIDQLIVLPSDCTPASIERAVAKYGFSRYVLTDEHSELCGYIHLKDVIDIDEAGYSRPIPASRIRSLISIADSTGLEDALNGMQLAGAHLARVFDADDTVTGVLFLEDILEVLVGEVHDATRR